MLAIRSRCNRCLLIKISKCTEYTRGHSYRAPYRWNGWNAHNGTSFQLNSCTRAQVEWYGPRAQLAASSALFEWHLATDFIYFVFFSALMCVVHVSVGCRLRHVYVSLPAEWHVFAFYFVFFFLFRFRFQFILLLPVSINGHVLFGTGWSRLYGYCAVMHYSFFPPFFGLSLSGHWNNQYESTSELEWERKKTETRIVLNAIIEKGTRMWIE